MHKNIQIMLIRYVKLRKLAHHLYAEKYSNYANLIFVHFEYANYANSILEHSKYAK